MGAASQHLPWQWRSRAALLPVPVVQELQQRYNGTATVLLEALRERLPPLDVPAMLETVQVGLRRRRWSGHALLVIQPPPCMLPPSHRLLARPCALHEDPIPHLRPCAAAGLPPVVLEPQRRGG